MKKLIILLIFSISITIIFADLNKLRIVDKAEQTNDIVPARYQTVNRERAACIIFITDLEVDLDFRPRLDLIALTNPAAGQFHVYIDPNERAIDVHALGYEPLIAVLSDYGIRRLRSSDVYRLRLTGDKKKSNPGYLAGRF